MTLSRLIGISYGSYLLLLPFLLDHSEGVMGRQAYPLFLTLAFLALLSIAGVILRFRRQMILRVRATDLLVGCYLLYGLIRILLSGIPTDPLLFYKWGALLLGYILIRTLPNPRPILVFLMLSGVAQAFVTFLQTAGLAESNHRLFDVTGSFGNPGQLGGFLAVSFVGACGLVRYYISRQKTIAVLSAVSVCLIGTALQMTDSRAGWFAACLSAGYLLFQTTETSRHDSSFRKSLWLAGSITVCILLAVFLYRYRPDSADGRLLIWRISGDMIADKPLFGHAPGSFSEKYMFYQEDYFSRNPESKSADVAGNTVYPFNEFIHAAVEQGVVGLAIWLVLLFLLLRRYPEEEPESAIFRSGLWAWCIFGCFSYPSYVFPLSFLFPVLAGGIKSKILFETEVHRATKGCVMVAATAVILVSADRIRFYHTTDRNIRAASTPDAETRRAAYAFIGTHPTPLSHNRIFQNVYSQLAYRYLSPEQSLPILDHAAGIVPSCELFCDLAETCVRLGKYDRAREYYETAARMLPSRMRPNYGLFVLYRETGDLLKARCMAEKIVAQSVRVVSTVTIRMKKEARDFLGS